jgi:L-ascorbate metabolism protein UlaG (beta-lactamase superfamily)
MRLTKLGHACVALEKDGARLVIDPGMWSGPTALAGANAILVTHEHPDHLAVDEIRAAMTADPGLDLWSNSAVTAQLADLGGRVHEVAHGDVFTAAGFDVHVYGREHARILPEVPPIANTGFAVDATVFHPGDSFTVPEDSIPTVLLPVAAPWLKFAELEAFAREVSAARGYAIHDAILSEQGIGLTSNLLAVMSGDDKGRYSRLAPGASVDL